MQRYRKKLISQLYIKNLTVLQAAHNTYYRFREGTLAGLQSISI